jgi:hypothetical protein
MTEEDLAKLDLLVRDANEAVAAGRKADSIRDELAFSVPKLLAELRRLRGNRQKCLDVLTTLPADLPEVAHPKADEALLACIDDPLIEAAFESLEKWYA